MDIYELYKFINHNLIKLI